MFSNKLGFQGLLKEGARHYQGVDEATLRNIDACRKLAQITHTSLGPNSMNKLIINHFEKQFVTSDAATIVNELEVQHPAARVAVLAAKMQELEFGDGTNFVLVLTGELLNQAEELLRQGLHCSDIVKGYELGLQKAHEALPSTICWKIENIRDAKELATAISTSLASKHLGSEALLSLLVSEAAVKVVPSNAASFDVDNIRVAKLCGGALSSSHVVDGMVVARDVSGTERTKSNCKVMVLGCGLEMAMTEAKGTVAINSAKELLDFTKGEEEQMESTIKAIADSGVQALVIGGAVSDLAQHFCNKYKLLTLKVQSKFELRRLCRTIGAVALTRMGAPTAEEAGYVQYIGAEEISSKKVTIIRSEDSKVATILLRGATMNVLDELERAIEDAMYCVKSLTRDPRFVPGAGAAEIQVAHQIQTAGAKMRGLEQYGMLKFAEALECVPRILAENAGFNSTEVITQLYAAHQEGKNTMGVNVLGGAGKYTLDAARDRLLDHHETKLWAIKLAADAAITVLRVDQIIMAKPAGGPKMPQGHGHWDDQD